MKLRVPAITVGAVALALTGCADDRPPGEGQRGPSKPGFITSADRLCSQAGEDYDAVIAKLPPFERIVASDVSSRTMLAVAQAAPQIAAVERMLQRRLRALVPPARLADRWDRALDTLEERADAAEQIQAAAEAGDRTGYLSAFQRFDRAGSVSSRALRGYGFQVCAAG